MKVIVVGCGRYGSLLANQVSSLGHSVVVIDRQEHAFIPRKATNGDFLGES